MTQPNFNTIVAYPKVFHDFLELGDKLVKSGEIARVGEYGFLGRPYRRGRVHEAHMRVHETRVRVEKIQEPIEDGGCGRYRLNLWEDPEGEFLLTTDPEDESVDLGYAEGQHWYLVQVLPVQPLEEDEWF